MHLVCGCMKIIFSLTLCFCFQTTFAQKLDINSLEKILYSSVKSADSLLKKSNFRLSDKEKGEGYCNYYYTSYERKELFKHLLRSISFMDVYRGTDTARLVLYRTYYENEQEEMKKQLLTSGYELSGQSGNNYIYKKGNYTITNKISEKKAPGNKLVTAYEFELGR
jgi:hypothetical protein